MARTRGSAQGRACLAQGAGLQRANACSVCGAWMTEEKKKKKWDLTRQGGMWSAMEWIRRDAGALLVVAIRVDDMAFSVAPGMTPKDAVDMLRDELPSLLAMLKQKQEAGKARAVSLRSGEATR